MARMRGMELPEPSSGGGGSLTNALMGAFRERANANRELQMAVYKSAIGVGADVASEQLKGDVRRQGLIEDFNAIYAKHPEGHPQAGQLVNPQLVKHVEEAGLEITPSGARFSPSSLTKAEMLRQGIGPFEQYKAPIGGVTPTTGPEKPTAGRGKKPQTAAVNNQTVTVTEPNVGNRAAKPTKGGFVQPTKRVSKKTAAKPPVQPAIVKPMGVAPSSYAEGSTPAPMSPASNVNPPKVAKKAAKRVAPKPMKPSNPPAGGTNA